MQKCTGQTNSNYCYGYTLRINYIILNEKEIVDSDDDISHDARGNITVNLSSSYLTFAGKTSTEITPEAIDGTAYFAVRYCYVLRQARACLAEKHFFLNHSLIEIFTPSTSYIHQDSQYILSYSPGTLEVMKYLLSYKTLLYYLPI